MTSPSSFNVAGLLSSSIDTTTLLSQLMQAQAIPQTQLKNQLNVQQAMLTDYQAVNTKVTAMQTAAQALTDPGAWLATAATSSNSSVVASSTSSAVAGSTTFDVVQLATAQISTVSVGGNGIALTNPGGGFTVTGSDGVAHQIVPSTGSAVDVAAAINTAGVGVRATLVNTTQGQVLQLGANSTGVAGGFTVAGLDSAANTIVAAKDAKVSVGDPNAGGYSVTSSTNTFSSFIPGVTFSVGALASGVTVTVAQDVKSISDKVQALVTAANAASTEIANDSGKGAILQGSRELRELSVSILSTVSQGTASGGSLKPYGIDMDKFGVLSFDATAFQAAYAADPTGTKTAVSGSFATNVAASANTAIAPVTGSIAQQITAATNQSSSLNKQIDAWTTRLADTQTRLQQKFTAMNTALARLQGQSTYLTNMLKSMNSSSSSS